MSGMKNIINNIKYYKPSIIEQLLLLLCSFLLGRYCDQADVKSFIIIIIPSILILVSIDIFFINNLIRKARYKKLSIKYKK